MRRAVHPEQAIDLPPQHALRADDADRLVERLGHGVVGAWEPTHEQLMGRDLAQTSLGLVHDLMDVRAHVLAGREVRGVAVEGMLSRGRWLPLVGPDDLPADSLQPEPESSDPREQLHDPRLARPWLTHPDILTPRAPRITPQDPDMRTLVRSGAPGRPSDQGVRALRSSRRAHRFAGHARSHARGRGNTKPGSDEKPRSPIA